MRRFIHNTIKYLPEIGVFGIIFAVLMIDLNPDFTFINKAADSLGYIYSAEYLYPSYHTSAPLYLLLGHAFLWLPFGTEAFRMGLISVLSTMGACVFLYLIIRNLIGKRFYAILGVLIYGLSALVISQSTIVNTYALTTMLVTGAYYFAVKKKWYLAAVMLGLSLAVHLLGFIVTATFLVFKEYRKHWRAMLVTASFVLLYLYVPITNRPPYMWLPDPSKVNSFTGVITDTISVIAMLVGTISVWDLPKKILDTIGIVGVGVGVVTLVPIVYYFKQLGKKMFRQPIFWLMVLPILLFVSELDMNTFDYCMISMPFLTIAACLGLNMMVERYRVAGRSLALACLAVVVGFGGYNAYFFDIGTRLDPNLGAAKLFRVEMPKIPDGAIFMPNGGWNWEAIFLYNRENNKNIYPICTDILPSETYRQKLVADGIKLGDIKEENLSLYASELAKSIVLLNDNVWTTVSTDPRTFSVEVVNANHNPDLINTVDRAIIEKNKTNPDIHWIPDSPYSIYTTSIFIDKWGYVLMSTYNFRFFIILFLGIYLILIYAPKLGKKKVKHGNEVLPQETQAKK